MAAASLSATELPPKWQNWSHFRDVDLGSDPAGLQSGRLDVSSLAGADQHIPKGRLLDGKNMLQYIFAKKIETRTGKIKQSPDAVVAGTPAIAELPSRAVRHATAVDPPDPPGAFPPRHVLFCVYLD